MFLVSIQHPKNPTLKSRALTRKITAIVIVLEQNQRPTPGDERPSDRHHQGHILFGAPVVPEQAKEFPPRISVERRPTLQIIGW